MGLSAAPDAPLQAVRAVPAERAAPAAQQVRAISAGTDLVFELREAVSTSSHDYGDTFDLVLVEAVRGPAGGYLAAGTRARGLVTEVYRSTAPDEESLLAVQVAWVEAGGSQRTIRGHVQSTELATSPPGSGARTAATIATGAAAGALIGQILGENTRSAVTSAAAGTAAGVAMALTTRGGDATLTEGSRVIVHLDRDLVF